MKRSVLSIVISMVGILSVPSYSETNPSPEIVELNVNLEVSRCDYGVRASSATCDSDASIGRDIAITLNHCKIVNSVSICEGTWHQERTRDGILFAADITAIGQHGDGQSIYTLEVSVGPVLNSQEPSTSIIYLSQGKTLTDMIRIGGTSISVSGPKDYNYRPALLIQKKVNT